MTTFEAMALLGEHRMKNGRLDFDGFAENSPVLTKSGRISILLEFWQARFFP
jgi:hypothetical protein